MDILNGSLREAMSYLLKNEMSEDILVNGLNTFKINVL